MGARASRSDIKCGGTVDGQSISLDVIQVKQPCPASWDAMRGDERTRFCEGCGRYVSNLSAMTRAEAAQLLEGCASAGRMCVRFERSPDGKVQTLDYLRPLGRRGRGWRFWTALGACLATGTAAANVFLFRSGLRLPPPLGRPQPTVVMGDICPVPTPAPPQAPGGR